jgi:hypothetical protein
MRLFMRRANFCLFQYADVEYGRQLATTTNSRFCKLCRRANLHLRS